MTELLENLKKATELADQLNDILFDIKCAVDYGTYDSDKLEECIQDALINSIHSYEWDKDNESDVSFENEPEKREIFFKGIKCGYQDALFWLSDYLGLISFYEQQVLPIFEKKE